MIPPPLPSRVRRLHLWARRAVEDWLGGAYHSVFKGVGIAFEEVREYQPGDDVRAIDWNVTARCGTPFIKRFVEERELTVMLAIDVGSSMTFGSGTRTKLQMAAETAALVALAALANNDRVGLFLYGGGVQKVIPPRKGTRHGLRLVRDLLRAADGAPLAGHVRVAVEPALNAAVQTLHRVLHRRTLVFLASDFAALGPNNPLRLVATRHDLIALFAQDAWERSLPDIGVLALRDPETGDAILLDTHEAHVRDAYRERMAARALELQRTIRRAGADWLELRTDEDHLGALRNFFKRRKRHSRAAGI